MAALEALDMPTEGDEDVSGPEPVDIKIMLEDALALLRNVRADCRNNDLVRQCLRYDRE